MIKEIHSALNACGIADSKGFCDALYKHSQLLTGSFLVKILSGGNWKPDDLDIVGNYRDPDEFIYWLFDTFGTDVEAKNLNSVEEATYTNIPVPLRYIHNYVKTTSTNIRKFFVPWCITQLDDDVFMESAPSTYKLMRFIDFDMISGYPSTLPIVSRKACVSPKLIINHIQYYEQSNGVNIDHPSRYIEKYFDLDFCKVYFDGRSVTVMNFDSLYQRNAVVSWPRYLSLHSNPSEKTAQHLLRQLHKRKEKYISRGFEAEIHDVHNRPMHPDLSWIPHL